MMCWVFCPLSHCPYFLCHFIQWCAGCSACYPTAPTSFVTSSNDALGILPSIPLSILPLSLHPTMCLVFCPSPNCPYFCCYFIQWCAGCSARYPTAHTSFVTSFNDVLGVLPVTPLPTCLLSLHPMMCWVFCPLPHCPYFCCHFIHWCAGCSVRYPTAHTSVDT